jgi:sporulation protein YlmC with PRC-barrel domain
MTDDLLLRDGSIELGLELLDRQLLDSEGVPCGNVDDLELDDGGDGGPVVTAILVSPGALGPRIGGLIGRVMLATWRRLHPDAQPSPIRIPWEAVQKADYAVHLTVQRHEAGLTRSEDWAYERVISKIPGLS